MHIFLHVHSLGTSGILRCSPALAATARSSLHTPGHTQLQAWVLSQLQLVLLDYTWNATALGQHSSYFLVFIWPSCGWVYFRRKIPTEEENLSTQRGMLFMCNTGRVGNLKSVETDGFSLTACHTLLWAWITFTRCKTSTFIQLPQNILEMLCHYQWIKELISWQFHSLSNYFFFNLH